MQCVGKANWPSWPSLSSRERQIIPFGRAGSGQISCAQDQLIAIRAGQLFDSRSGSIRNNQVRADHRRPHQRRWRCRRASHRYKGDRPELGGRAPRHDRHPCPCDQRRDYPLGLWKPSCRRDRNGASQVCHEGGRDYSKRSRFWCGGAHTLGLPFAFANNPSLIRVCSRA
jgi:hypothetical protein